MKLSRSHLRILLVVILCCSGGILASLFSGVEPVQALPAGLGTALPIMLGVGAVLVPLGALMTRFSVPGRLTSAVSFVVPLFSFAVLLTPHLDVFPIRMLAIIGLLASFAGTILAIVSAAERRQGGEAPIQSRF